ncbi:MAG: hypothetical protein ACI3YK_04100 [Eubacteriales bacterium]
MDTQKIYEAPEMTITILESKDVLTDSSVDEVENIPFGQKTLF